MRHTKEQIQEMQRQALNEMYILANDKGASEEMRKDALEQIRRIRYNLAQAAIAGKRNVYH